MVVMVTARPKHLKDSSNFNRAPIQRSRRLSSLSITNRLLGQNPSHDLYQVCGRVVPPVGSGGE
jgi:hypothetical protein